MADPFGRPFGPGRPLHDTEGRAGPRSLAPAWAMGSPMVATSGDGLPAFPNTNQPLRNSAQQELQGAHLPGHQTRGTTAARFATPAQHAHGLRPDAVILRRRAPGHVAPNASLLQAQQMGRRLSFRADDGAPGTAPHVRARRALASAPTSAPRPPSVRAPPPAPSQSRSTNIRIQSDEQANTADKNPPDDSPGTLDDIDPIEPNAFIEELDDEADAPDTSTPATGEPNDSANLDVRDDILADADARIRRLEQQMSTLLDENAALRAHIEDRDTLDEEEMADDAPAGAPTTSSRSSTRKSTGYRHDATELRAGGQGVPAGHSNRALELAYYPACRTCCRT